MKLWESLHTESKRHEARHNQDQASVCIEVLLPMDVATLCCSASGSGYVLCAASGKSSCRASSSTIFCQTHFVCCWSLQEVASCQDHLTYLHKSRSFNNYHPPTIKIISEVT